MSLPIQPVILKPRLTLLYIGLAIAAVVFLIVSQNSSNGQADWIVLFVIGFCALLWFLLRKMELQINNEGLTHKTFFTTRQILWEDVIETYIKYQQHGKSGHFYWNFILSGNRDVRFSTSLYSRQSLRQVAEAVLAKCGKAVVQERIQEIAQGKFPWYMF